jgi:hypothetical protein
MVGGAWPAERIQQISPDHASACRRCFRTQETCFHVFWECSANADIESEYVSKTQNLCEEAKREHTLFPAMWLRGLLPAHFTEVPPEYETPTSELKLTYENPSNDWVSGTYYGDASGGKHTAISKLRRVGCAVVRINPDQTVYIGVASNLPGRVQSVGRGELFALWLLATNLQVNAVAHFITDNISVNNTYNNGELAAKNSANCDLFKLVFQEIKEKNLSIKVTWMPSHLDKVDPAEWPEDVSSFDVFSNGIADKFAGREAFKATIPDHAAANVVHYVDKIVKIQKRIATILLSLPERQKHEKKKKEVIPRIPLASLVRQTRHTTLVKDNRVWCKVCHNSFNLNDPAAKLWLKSDCTGSADVAQTHNHIRLLEPIHIGNQISHISHSLYNYRGLIYCGKCGARSGKNQIRYLAHVCTPADSSTGQRQLQGILRGKLPNGCLVWPDQVLEAQGLGP